jgi:hypothetical protein
MSGNGMKMRLGNDRHVQVWMEHLSSRVWYIGKFEL